MIYISVVVFQKSMALGYWRISFEQTIVIIVFDSTEIFIYNRFQIEKRIKLFKRFCSLKSPTSHRPEMQIPIACQNYVVVHNAMAKNSIDATLSWISQIIFNLICFRRINGHIVIHINNCKLCFQLFFAFLYIFFQRGIFQKTFKDSYFLDSFYGHIKSFIASY